MDLEDFPWSKTELALYLGVIGQFSFVAVVSRALGVVFAIVVAVVVIVIVVALSTTVGYLVVGCLIDFH